MKRREFTMSDQDQSSLQEESQAVEVDVRFNPGPVKARRITVVENVYYHSSPMENPEHFQESYGFPAVTDLEDGCYTRKTRATREATPLDSGWVEDAAFILVHNHAGENPQVIPSPEEKEEISKQVVEVLFDDNCCLIVKPGTNIRFTPDSLNCISIRCRYGTARISYTIVPG
jgi:hypothetical protein